MTVRDQLELSNVVVSCPKAFTATVIGVLYTIKGKMAERIADASELITA